MRLKNLVVYDPKLKGAAGYRMISSLKDFESAIWDRDERPFVFDEEIVGLHEAGWKRFMDLFLLSRNADPARHGGLDFDYLETSKLKDFEYPSRVTERSGENSRLPKYSIVIPFRDRDHTLPAVLNRISHLETHADFEVILVNDGSLKPVSEEVRKALSSLKRPWVLVDLPPSRYFRAGFARNVGSVHAQGEVLLFIDSDILLKETFLEELEVQLHSGEIIQARRWQIWKDDWRGLDLNGRELEEPNGVWRDFHTSEVPWMERPQPWRMTSTYCLAIRREHFVELGGFRIWFAKYGFEDTDLGLRAYKKGWRLKRSDSDVFHLSPHPRRQGMRGPSVRRDNRMRESARRYFILNGAADSLGWLTKHML